MNTQNDVVMIRPLKRINSFLFGVSLPWKALRLITQHRSLMLWSILPVLITGFIYVFVILQFSQSAMDYFELKMTSWGVDATGILYTIAAWIFKVALWILAAITFSFSATVVAAPFNDFLAETSEQFATPPIPKAAGASLFGQARLMILDVGKSIAATIAALVALLLAWVPVLNLFGFLLACLLVCFQYTSYPQTRRGIGLRDGMRFLLQHAYVCTGFGLVITFLFSIPFLSLLALPLAVVGGTLLVARSGANMGQRLLR